jgi:hypothetical protein
MRSEDDRHHENSYANNWSWMPGLRRSIVIGDQHYR